MVAVVSPLISRPADLDHEKTRHAEGSISWWQIIKHTKVRQNVVLTVRLFWSFLKINCLFALWEIWLSQHQYLQTQKMCHHKFHSSLKTLALFGCAFTHKISPFVCSASERYLLNLSVIISKNQLFSSLVMQTQTVKRALRDIVVITNGQNNITSSLFNVGRFI